MRARLAKAEEGQNCQNDDDEADQIDDTVHVIAPEFELRDENREIVQLFRRAPGFLHNLAAVERILLPERQIAPVLSKSG